MADNETKIILDLDNEDFVKKLQDSLGLMKDLGSGDSLKGLVQTLGEVGLVLGIVAAAGLAVKTAIDMEVEAEKIKQVNTTFEALAASVGLSADKLKNGLLVAVKGLASETEVLQAANKQIITMGENASRLPEIMDMARKATVVFGGNLIDNFNQMSMAIANGNTRMLRHFGIVVDATKAQDEYAKSLGVGREYLDDTGRRMAIMNAALEQGKEKFKNVAEEGLQTTNSLQRISTSLTEIKETAILAWDKLAGPLVSKMVSGFADTVHGVALQLKEWLGKGKDQASAHEELLKRNIAYEEKQIELYGKMAANDVSARMEVDERTKRVAKMRAELDGINATNQKAIEIEKQKAAEEKKNEGGDDGKKKGIDYTKLEKEHEKFQADLLKLTEERIKAEEKAETSIEQADQSVANESVRIRKTENQQIEELHKQKLEKGVINEKEYAQAVSEIHKRANAQVESNERSKDQRELQALKNLEAANQKTAAGFSAAWARNALQAKQNFQNMAKFGDAAFHAIGSNATNAFVSIGKGSKDAGEIMKGFFFGAIGDMAVAQGEAMLLMGLWPPNPVAIAGGGALIALGTALKSQSQGSSSSGFGGGGGGGGGGISGSTIANQNTPPTPAAAPEKKTVTVAISGHYFETDQTRTRLMDMIREAGDFTDFNLKQIGQP